MKKIDDLIQTYDMGAFRKEDVVIKAKLKLIKELSTQIENSEDKLLMDEIMGAFCQIIDLQQEVIGAYMQEEAAAAGFGPMQHQFATAYTPQNGDFTDDEQLQKAFVHYLTHGVKKPLSSYTVNDYCCRIKNLWKSLRKAQEESKISQMVLMEQCVVSEGNPFLNVYKNVEILEVFVSAMLNEAGDKRNWANAQAALRKLDEFKNNR